MQVAILKPDMEGVDGIADGLDGAAEGRGDASGALSLRTGDEDLAAAEGERRGRAESGPKRLVLVRRGLTIQDEHPLADPDEATDLLPARFTLDLHQCRLDARSSA